MAFKLSALPKELQERIDALPDGGSDGWQPRRLILQNFWHFSYQEFDFAHGRLVLRGANTSGKSTVLVAAITLVLDGEKRRERMDTFGSQSRSVAYYLLGDPKATPDSDFYHQERTGYVALELRNRRTGEYFTIGVGMYGSRSRADIESWGFGLKGGRRIGIDLLLHTGGSKPTPLSELQLEDAIGADGFVKRRAMDYQTQVNEAIFGFDHVDQYKFLLQILLQLRSPKLNKDTKPSDVCDILSESLPPLEDDLLNQVAQIIEDIDSCIDSLATTRAQLEAVAQLDSLLAGYLNQLAQEVALDYREIYARLSASVKTRNECADELALEEDKLRRLETELHQNGIDESSHKGRLGALKEYEGYKSREQLVALEAELKRLRGGLTSHRAVFERAEKECDKLRGELDESRTGWDGEIEEQRKIAAEHLRRAEDAVWALARDRFTATDAALATASLEGNENLGSVLAASVLKSDADSRIATLRLILVRLKGVESADGRHQAASTLVDAADKAFKEAFSESQAAGRALEEARGNALTAVGQWRSSCHELRISDETFQSTAVAIEGYSDAADLRILLTTIEHQGQEHQKLLASERGKFIEERFVLSRNRIKTQEELTGWIKLQEAEPPRRPQQVVARRLLGEKGIPAVPLYLACDLRSEVDSRRAAQLEETLEESGLLDALIVPHALQEEAAALLDEAGLGDRWLRAGASVDGPSVGDLLVPIPDREVGAEDIARVLRTFMLADQPGAHAFIGETGTWRIGPLTGTSSRSESRAVLYIGESNRRHERARNIARLEAALADLDAQLMNIEDILQGIADREDATTKELQVARDLPALVLLQRASMKLTREEEVVEKRKKELRDADVKRSKTYDELLECRSACEEAIKPLPEARGRTIDGVAELLEATKDTLGGVRRLSDRLAHVPRLRRVHADKIAALASASKRVEEAQGQIKTAEQQVAESQARCTVVRERLSAISTTFEEVTLEVAQLERKLEDLTAKMGDLREHLGEAKRAKKELTEKVEGLNEAIRGERDQARETAERLRGRLEAYPTLQKELELLRDREEGPSVAAEELLKLRRTRQDELRQKVRESVQTSYNELVKAFGTHRSELVEFRPELEDGLLRFHEQGSLLLPFTLRKRLEQHRDAQQHLLQEKETKLYEDFILKQVATAIRERIDVAEHWIERVNVLLGDRRLSNDELLSISWRPVSPDSVTGMRPARLVELLRRDVETLTDTDLEELTKHFRTSVSEVREQDRKNTLEAGFGDALRAALDYRQWFEFSLHTKLPKMERLELTDLRYGTRSGAEKALAVFIPLLAAAHARFTGAADTAPKLLGLDEAFAGVDAQNTREMFRFLSELEFSWIMTSEKLWGVADTLTACVTYELVRRGSVVTAIFHLWDGKTTYSILDLVAKDGSPSG